MGDLVKSLRGLADCEGESLGRCMHEAADAIEALKERYDAACQRLADYTKLIAELEAENKRLREALIAVQYADDFDEVLNIADAALASREQTDE